MLSTLLILLVAAIHFYFVYLECFAWEAPRTRRIFGLTEALARDTRMMATNQGLYNGFLATGFLFALFTGNGSMAVFLLLCVATAGVVAALTGVKPALIFQTAPAVLALALRGVGQ